MDLSGLWIPLVTPFSEGRVDGSALAGLVRHLRTQGVAGFVACGSTGEAAALDKAEQRGVLDTVLDAAGGLPVVMGVSGYHLAQTQAWVRELAPLPLAGLLVSAPYYIRPSQAGLLQWFRAIADSAAVPLLIYDIPYRTGVAIERDTLMALAEHPGIAGVKDCGGDAAKTLALIAQGEVQILAGEDLQLFATVAQGGAGAITASAHLGTAAFARVVQLLRAGELAQARALWLPLLPWIEAVFAEPNPAPVKTALARLGLLRDEMRAPMSGTSDMHAARVAALASALG